MNSAPSRRPAASLRLPAALTRAAAALAVTPVVLAAGLLVPGLPARAATAEAESTQVTGQACTEDDGVTVVVDLTDLGEDVRVGCATGDPASGREALEKAGFTTTDSVPGMICAIDNLPDPCPEEFDGRYWAYFSAEADGAWTAQTEGADTADPAPGTFEGWRYNDGSAGPGVEAAALSDAAAEPVETATGDAAPAAEESQTEEEQGGPSAGTVVALGAAAVAVAVAVVLLRRRGGGRA